jgi:hypothetical protein
MEMLSNPGRIAISSQILLDDKKKKDQIYVHPNRTAATTMLSVFITHLKTEETEDRTGQYYEVHDVDIILCYFLSSVQIYTLMAAHKQDFLEPLPTSSLQNHMTTLNNFPFTLSMVAGRKHW